MHVDDSVEKGISSALCGVLRLERPKEPETRRYNRVTHGGVQIMSRAIFSHEVVDPDFQWLLESYAERNKYTTMVDVTSLPVVLLLLTEEEKQKATGALYPLAAPELGEKEMSETSDDSDSK